MALQSFPLINLNAGGPVVATGASGPGNAQDANGVAITATTAGTGNATLKLQVSNDMPTPITWIDVAGSNKAVSGSMSVNWDQALNSPWVRVSVTVTSGSTSATFAGFGKGGSAA